MWAQDSEEPAQQVVVLVNETEAKSKELLLLVKQQRFVRLDAFAKEKNWTLWTPPQSPEERAWWNEWQQNVPQLRTFEVQPP